MRADRYLTGWLEVTVSGADPARTLRALAERGIPFWDAEPPRDFSLRLKLPSRYEKLLTILGPQAECEIRITARRGLPAALRGLRRRLGAVLLLAAALILLTLSLSRIWYIDIEGNATIPEGTIRQALAECGVDIGERWVGMSQDQIRNSVILRIPEIRWMTVTMTGCRARVIVREARPAIEPVPEKEYARVVADKAGFVTEVRALRGTAVAQPDRAVLPGEEIIGGYATGRFGVQGPVRAIGYARVRTWYELTAVLPAETLEKTRSDEARVLYSLVFGKTRINFYKDSSICPAGCDKIIKEYTLGREGSFTLPVALVRTTLTGYGLRPTRTPEREEALRALLTETLAERIGEDGEVLSASFTSGETEGMLCVTLRAECSETVGRTVPLTEEEIRAVEAKIPKTEDQDT